MRYFEGQRDRLREYVDAYRGWLAFFSMDARYRVCSIKFRKPYSKRFVTFAPCTHAGVFGHEMFTPYESEHRRRLNEFLIVVEGEFNQLQVQSLMLRHGEQRGGSGGYVYACAVGGVNAADMGTLRRLAPAPYICYDNDVSGAGFELVKKAQEHVHVRAWTVPIADGDLDEYIRSFGTDYDGALEAIKRLVKGARRYPRSFASVRGDVDFARRNAGGSSTGGRRMEFERHRAAAAVVLFDLHQRGDFYHDEHSCYFYHRDTGEILSLERQGTALVDTLLREYGINASSNLHRYMLHELRYEASTNGRRVRVERFAWYDKRACTLYVYDNAGYVYRIREDAFEHVENGADGVLFDRIPGADPIVLPDQDEPAPIDTGGTSLLQHVVLNPINFEHDALSPRDRRDLFAIWFYSLFFESIMPTKPLMAMVGPKGSGKSITLRKVVKLLYGARCNVKMMSKDERDFDSTVTNAPFVAFDNVDSHCPWLNDRLAAMATGCSISKRVLYTTNEVVDIPVRCFIALTARTPRFRRDDVADRLLIMKVKAYPEFHDEEQYLQEVDACRPWLWEEILVMLHGIVRTLSRKKKQQRTRNARGKKQDNKGERCTKINGDTTREAKRDQGKKTKGKNGGKKTRRTNQHNRAGTASGSTTQGNEPGEHSRPGAHGNTGDERPEAKRPGANNRRGTPLRLGDFAAFAKTFAQRTPALKRRLDDILSNLTEEQSTFTLEGDSVYELLALWLENPLNQGTTITTGDLCRELSALAEEKNLKFPYANKPRVFGRKLNNIKANLEQFFEIEETRGHQSKRFYSFTHREK